MTSMDLVVGLRTPGAGGMYCLSATGMDCHTSRLKVRHAPRRPKASGGSNAPLGLLSPQRVSLCGAPIHALVRNDRQKAGAAGRGNGAVSHDFRKSC